MSQLDGQLLIKVQISQEFRVYPNVMFGSYHLAPTATPTSHSTDLSLNLL